MKMKVVLVLFALTLALAGCSSNSPESRAKEVIENVADHVIGCARKFSAQKGCNEMMVFGFACHWWVNWKYGDLYCPN
ncbi:MAG: hypothetical protein OEY59_08645 [Deltaproteobacteria bacterium]|nr:hypothetical protein [Deltaproteobacteria bacterium]